MRRDFENDLLNIIRAIVVDKDSARAAEIASMAKLSLTDEGKNRFEEIKSFAKRHQLEHFVDYALSTCGNDLAMTDFYASFSVTTQQSVAARELSQAFSRNEIDHILLKGTVIRSLYPEGWMRNSCDIDVLVHDFDLERASKVLMDLGYTMNEAVTVHDISFYKDILHVELHYRLIEDFRMAEVAAVLDNVWDHAYASEADKHAFLIPDNVSYFYHVAHAAKHFGDGGCGIRPVLDTWILNNRCEFDKSARSDLIRQAGLEKFELAISRLAEYWFGTGIADGLLDIESYLFSGGAYGNVDQARKVRKTRKGRLGYLLSRAFMPYKDLSRKYPVLKKHPYLFPILEVWRWHEFFGKNRRAHAKEFKDTLKRSDETIEMITRLGLSDFT